MDHLGRICGTKMEADTKNNVPAYDLTNYKYLAYPRLAEDLYEMGMATSFNPMDPKNLKKLYGVCVDKCPSTRDASGNPQYVHALNTYGVDGVYVVGAASKAWGTQMEDEKAGSPFKVMVNTTNGM